MMSRKLLSGIMAALVMALACTFDPAAAYADAGDLDHTFSQDGLATADFINTGEDLRDIAVQSNGKIVAVGSTYISGNNYNFTTMRFNTDGSLDGTFSLDGKVSSDFFGGEDHANAVLIQPDGKIVVAGSAQFEQKHILAYVRYNSDGSLDTSFCSTGKCYFGTSTSDTEDAAFNAIAIQPDDGKLILAGYTSTGPADERDFRVVRVNTNGFIDSTFGGTYGTSTEFFGHEDQVRAVAVQAGSIVAAGFTQLSASNFDFAVVRYNLDGTLNSGFDGDGKVTTDFFGGDDGAYGMALQPDGKIVAVGGFYSASQAYDFGIVRYLSNGALDTTFDNDGLLALNFVSGTANEVALDVAVYTNGKIVVAGYSAAIGFNGFTIARLNPNGSLDTSFSGNGWLAHSFGVGVSIAYGVAIAPDKKIVAGGPAYMGDPNDYDFAVARYLSGYEPIATATRTNTRTRTRTPTLTRTPTHTATRTATITRTRTRTATLTRTPTRTATVTRTRTRTATLTRTPTRTKTLTRTATRTVTPTRTRTRTATRTTTVGALVHTSTPCAMNFSDVRTSDFFYEPVRQLYCAGVISGYTDGSFRPFNNTTRSQLTKIVVGAEGWAINSNGGPHFRDVARDNPFYDFVETAFNRGIIAGYNDAARCAPSAAPCFKPFDNVTRGQLSKIIVLAEGWQLLNPATPTFGDVNTANPFYREIETAVAREVISGYDDDAGREFRWSNNATRGQISKIVFLAVTTAGK